ncbi:MAG: histidine phosphatase family protein [Pseudomonadales bacterium]|jgi:broad specificity phosphatase PhoE|nr:histidine phosphatase family protein [Pseudomonadales bacterium]
MTLEVPDDARVLLLRHGAFERVEDETGRRSERLLPEAVAQADAIAEALGACGRALVLYASPQPRAVLTAERLASRLELTLFADPDLAELRLGRDPDLDAAMTAEIWRRARAQPGVPALEGAETAAALGARGLATLVSAVRAHPERIVLAVSHGGLVEAVLAALDAETASREIDFGEAFWLGGEPLALLA